MSRSRTIAATRGRYHHGDLEHALLSEATDQVLRRGADAVSLRQVAQAVGVSPSAAYSHFPDKTALLLAVAECGMSELDRRMESAASSVIGDDDPATIERFRATGQAYVLFALEQPHMFRHVFGPLCAADHEHGTMSKEYETAVSYQVLCRGLDDLEARGLLRQGVRDGLDVVVWTMVHGFASLVLDGFLPPDVGPILIDALGRLALADHARTLVAT